MQIRLCILGIFIVLGITSGSAQGYFAQFKTSGLNNEQECRDFENFLREESGIQQVRSESFSGNVLLISPQPIAIDAQQFEEWCIASGLTMKCFRTGALGVDRIERFTNDCDISPSEPSRE
jgi:hypothetical protein